MNGRVIIAALALLALLALLPGAASARTVAYKGKLTDPADGSRAGTITFDVKVKRGKPKSISEVWFRKLSYHCHNGADPVMDLPIARFGTTIPVNAKRRFRFRDRKPSPNNDTGFFGRFRGKRSQNAAGTMFDQWGFGPVLGDPYSYNCATGFLNWKAKRKR